MSDLTLKDVSAMMKHIDICMMATKTARGALESRPMSNNRQVDYDGDSYFFAYDSCSAAQEIAADAEVNLGYAHEHALGKNTYISITGKAALVRDRATMEKHWNKDVEIWFTDGLDTPGIVLIHVAAARIKYWHGQDEGEITV